ncbi:MAG: hypothetical protein ABII74_01605 [Elusimicrobiota bacterium]
MKRIISLIVGLMIISAGLVYSATEDSTTVTVTVQYLSVDIQEPSGFGPVAAGSTFNLATTSCTVVNDGNWESKWSFKCSSSTPTGWTPTSGGAPSTNVEYRLCAVFKSTAAVTVDFLPANDYLNTGYRPSGANTNGAFYEYPAYGGQNVAASAPSNSRNLWFSFCAPTSAGGNPNSSQQTISVYVQTQAQ